MFRDELASAWHFNTYYFVKSAITAFISESHNESKN